MNEIETKARQLAQVEGAPSGSYSIVKEAIALEMADWMKTTVIENIRQEIKRRIKNLEFSLENNCVEKHSKLDILGNITTLESLLQFLDSI